MEITDTKVVNSDNTNDGTAGDIFLLCSNRLTGVLEDEAIRDILCRDVVLEEKKQALIDESLKNGSRDNITVVLIEI